MLKHEAQWFGRRMAELDADAVFPMLNVGSHTEAFRTVTQPWIDHYMFAPARARAQVVRHSDMRAGVGIDIVGDLRERRFLAELAQMRFRSVTCCNLLEHLENREEIAGLVTAIVPAGGYLFVSCPHRFPYHPDPIDTMFRPDVRELAALFQGTHVVHAELLSCGTLATYAFDTVVARLRHRDPQQVAEAPADTADSAGPSLFARVRYFAPWAVRRLQVTCLVLRKHDT